MATFLHCVCLLALLPRNEAVLPKPLSQKSHGGVFSLSDDFNFMATGIHSSMLQSAFDRYKAIIYHRRRGQPSAQATIVTGCDVNVTSNTSVKQLETDESYTLRVDAPRIIVHAPTVFGAMYALETLSQLVRDDLTVEGTTIADRPRFKYRGTMLDTARHYYPLRAIKMHIDAMSYAKMNVLHWHLVDGIAFPYQSEVLPQLSAEGAFSPKHVYALSDIRELVQYAMARGVRVIPEFDTPGHVSRGWGSLGVLTQCYDSSTGKPTNLGALNPTLNRTYAVLAQLFAEVKAVFAPESYIHIGGDEVPKACWESNPQLRQWMAEHPAVKDFAGLETYFEQQLVALLKAQGSSYIVWQEILDNGAKVAPETVIEVWKAGPSGYDWQGEMARVSGAGYRTVLSAPFYLNLISYGADWVKYYTVEPANFTGGGTAESAGLLGGVEACFWSEYIDATNLASRAWPRTAAIAERAWSSATTTNLTDAEARLHRWRCMVLRRGISAEPIGTCSVNAQRVAGPTLNDWCSFQVPGYGGFCADEWEPPYDVPWAN